MPPETYRLCLPAKRRSCVVFSSPHSGACYPQDFLAQSVLDRQQIRSSEDAFIDDLFAPAPASGAPLLSAEIPRAFIDLNRAPDEFDPAVIEGVIRTTHSPRISSGLGVIPRVVANGRAIYNGKLSRVEAERRVAQYWQPYHDRLQALLDESHARFGQAILVDCHSMPREALEGLNRIGRTRPEVVLGDRFGASAAPHITDAIEKSFEAAGFAVARNTPFAGAYIAQHYGRPSRRQHAIQVEIDRSLYMDETSIERRADYPVFRKRLGAVIVAISRIGAAGGDTLPLAAE